MQGVLKSGKVNFLFDIGAGSSGKGQIASAIALRERPKVLISNSANSASHTFTGFGETFVFKVLPVASALNRYDLLGYEPIVFIAPSAGFEIEQLRKEIEWCKLPKDKIIVSARAFVVEEEHKIRENQKANCGKWMDGGVTHLGSTSSGQSAGFYDKISRDKCYKWAGDRPEIEEFATVVDYPEFTEMIKEHLDRGEIALYEMPQGYMLSIDYSPERRKSTFRNINPLQAMSDIGLNQFYMGNSIGNLRVYPIRVSNRFVNNSMDKVKLLIMDKNTGEEKIVTPSEVGLTYSDVNSIAYEIMENKKPVTPYGFDDFIVVDIIEGYVGTSGAFMPDEREVSWREIADNLGVPVPDLLELTTLTKLPRRIAKPKNDVVSAILLNRAVMTTGFNILSMTFLNYKGFKNPNDPEFLKFKDSVEIIFGKAFRKNVPDDSLKDSNYRFALAQFGKDILDVYYI